MDHGTTIVTRDGAHLGVTGLGDLADRDRPLAILQHGFPDSPATWRHLGPRLVAEGYRVATPWLRGYGPSGASVRSAASLGPPAIAADLLEVRAALHGDDRTVLVGHDWGAVGGWEALAAPAGTWAAAVMLAIPPEAALRDVLRDPRQAWRWWYMVLAQAPVEVAPARVEMGWLRLLWRTWSPGHRITDEDLDGIREGLADPDHLRTALGHYRWMGRAFVRGRMPRRGLGWPAHVPTLLLHGADDGCIGPRYARAAGSLLEARTAHPGCEVVVLDGVGHFLHLEAPGVVGDAVCAHLSAHTTAAR